MIADVAFVLGCVLAYVTYVAFAFRVLRICIDRVEVGTWLDKLLDPFMLLLLVSTFPCLLVIWILDMIADTVKDLPKTKDKHVNN